MEEPIEKIISLLNLATLKQFKEKHLACYTPMKARMLNAKECAADLLADMKNFINDANLRAALLLGDSGGGKTLFGQFLVKQLWDEFHRYKSPQWLPLWISLPTIEHPSKNLIGKHLQNLGIAEQHRSRIIDELPLFIVLDAADEMVLDENLFESNNFSKKKIKVLTTFRSESLKPNRYYQRLLTPLGCELLEYELLPLTPQMRSIFLKKYVGYHKPGFDKQTFLQHFETLIHVDALISNPYHFYLALKVLPKLVSKYANKDRLERIKLTRHDLYKEFVQQRFERQQKKLLVARGKQVAEFLTKKNKELGKENWTLLDSFQEYCHKLAQIMFEHKITQVSYHPESNLQLPFSNHNQVGSFGIERPDDKQQRVIDTWQQEFFDDNTNPDLEMIRTGCPIKQVAPGEWTFLHKSLLEFFTADYLFNSAITDAMIMAGHNLNNGNLQHEPAVLEFLVDLTTKDNVFKDVLFAVIELSKYEPRVWKAAANAATLLNYAGVCLSGKDFRGARLGGYDEINDEKWGADLSYCYLYRTDFSESDIRYVNFIKSNLDYAKFNNACVVGINLGEKLSLKASYSCYSADGAYFAITKNHTTYFRSGDLIAVYDCENYRLINKFNTPDNTYGMVFLPNCQELVTWHNEKELFLNFWYVKTGNSFRLNLKLGEPIESPYPIRDVAFSPSQNQVAVLVETIEGMLRGEAKKIILFNTKSGEAETSAVIEGEHTKNRFHYSKNGSYFGISDGNTIRLYGPKKQRCLLKHRYLVLGFYFTDDNKVITLNQNTEVSFWSLEPPLKAEKKIKLQFKTYGIDAKNIDSISFCNNQKEIAISVGDMVTFWDMEQGCGLNKIEGNFSGIHKISYHPKKKVMMVQSTRRVYVIDLDNCSLFRSRKYIKEPPQFKFENLSRGSEGYESYGSNWYDAINAVFTPDIKNFSYLNYSRLVTRSSDTMEEVTNNELDMKSLNAHSFGFNHIAYSPSGNLLAWRFHLNEGGLCVLIYNLIVKQYLLTPEMLYQPMSGFAFSHDDRFLAVASDKGKLWLFCCDSGGLVKLLNGPPVYELNFSTDGQQLVSVLRDKACSSLCLWDVNSGTYKLIPTGVKILRKLRFHPNNEILALSFEYNKIGIWNLKTNKWNLIFHPLTYYTLGRTFPIVDLCWIDNGEKLAILDEKTIISVWHIGATPEENFLVSINTSSHEFSAHEIQIGNCYGISADNFKILSKPQRKYYDRKPALGLPDDRKVQKVIDERQRQIFIPEGFLTFPGINKEGDFVITPQRWVISLVRKRHLSPARSLNNLNGHAWLLIQGMTDNQFSHIQEIHFFLDLRERTYFLQSIGKGLIQIRSKSPRDLKALVDSNAYIAKSWNVDKGVVTTLLSNVEKDQQKKIDYLITGYTPGYFGRSAYNCLTWCEFQLQQVGIQLEIPSHDLFCALPSAHIPETGPNQSATCITM